MDFQIRNWWKVTTISTVDKISTGIEVTFTTEGWLSINRGMTGGVHCRTISCSCEPSGIALLSMKQLAWPQSSWRGLVLLGQQGCAALIEDAEQITGQNRVMATINTAIPILIALFMVVTLQLKYAPNVPNAQDEVVHWVGGEIRAQ